MAHDPLGKMPRRRTGRAEADYTCPETGPREAMVAKAVKTIWIDHPPQANAVGRILAYRLEALGEDTELDGLCLSQDSQAGKTRTARRAKELLMAESAARGETPNEHQVVIVGLDQKTNLKSVLQDILIKLRDPDWDLGTEKQLRQRIAKAIKRLCVELIVIDECQHLSKGGNDVADVTDAIKRILDMAIAPLVLIGNFDAKAVYNRNKQLRARLGLPLELPALNAKRNKDAILFRNFIVAYDTALVDCGAVEVSPNLADPDTLEGIKDVCGGYIGRAARLLKNAAKHAAARGAETIEAYDLSHVTRNYAMDSQWIDHDPFSRPTG